MPEGFCQCGCGVQTNLRPKTIGMMGVVKGQPYRYIRNHHKCRVGPLYVVDPVTGCWLWQGSKHPQGYGHIWHEGRVQRAHRVFFEAKFGPLPNGYEPDHLCRNTSCVNPDHMESVTHAENSRRSSAAKLNRDTVTMIFALGGRLSQQRIGDLFGVSQTTVGRILSGKLWAA